MQYDLMILGAGPGGYVAAIRAAQLGLKVGLVERNQTLGGTCLNIGCIPSKALLDSTELYTRLMQEGREHGILCGDLSFDLPRMMTRKQKVVRKLTKGVELLMKQNKVDVFFGEGSIDKSHEIIIKDAAGKRTSFQTQDIILATGSISQTLPFLPVDGKTVVTSTEALSFDAVPESLIVVGAGAIGLELGSVWARLGTKVTVVELLPQILPGGDQEISRALARELKKQGLEIHVSTGISEAEVSDTGAVLKGKDASGNDVAFQGAKVLVAVGRKPCLDGIDVEKLNLEFWEDKRHLNVNERYQTNVPHIYAIGDVIHGPMLAHKAEEEGVASVEGIAGKAGHVNYTTIPGVVYTWPEAASVGATEEELKRQHIAYKKGVFPFSVNGRSAAMAHASGFVKVLAEAEYDRVLGVHIVGPWASDLIEEAVVLMEFGGSAEDLARTIHPHPTLSEAVKEAALGVDGRMIHL